MTLRLRALAPLLTLAALAASVAAVRAQSTGDYPRGRISGYLFGDYYDNLAGDPRHAYAASGADSGQANIDGSRVITRDLNGLQIRRLYLQLDNDLSARYATRVRLEADGKSLMSDGKIGVAMKALYVQAKSVLPRTDIYLGMMPTAIFENVDEFWSYRSIEKSLPDFRNLSPSADMGVELKGYADPGRVVGFSAMLGNGTGQKPETNRQKRVSLSLPIRWKDLHAEPYVDYENVYGGQDRATYQAFVGCDLPRHAAIGWEMSDQVQHEPAGAFKEPRGHSFFARIQPVSTLGAFARLDLWQPDKRAANRVDQQLWIAGLDWQPYPDVHVMPNVEAMQYDAKGTGVAPAHHDLQARITFFWKFSRPQS